MYFFIKKKNSVLKVLGFLLMFHGSVFASTAYADTIDRQVNESVSVNKTDKVEVSLDMGDMGMVTILILTSLLGAFFARNELGSI